MYFTQLLRILSQEYNGSQLEYLCSFFYCCLVCNSKIYAHVTCIKHVQTSTCTVYSVCFTLILVVSGLQKRWSSTRGELVLQMHQCMQIVVSLKEVHGLSWEGSKEGLRYEEFHIIYNPDNPNLYTLCTCDAAQEMGQEKGPAPMSN